MTSLLRGLIYGVVWLSVVSAIEFGDYKLYDPSTSNVTDEELFTSHVDAKYLKASNQTQVILPPESGMPELFEVTGLIKESPIRIVRNHTEGTARGVHLVYSVSRAQVVFDVAEGKSEGNHIRCDNGDMRQREDGNLRCVAIVAGWMSEIIPTTLFVFQHVVHSRLIAFMAKMNTFYFYILGKNDVALQLKDIDTDAEVELWYIENVEYDDKEPLTLGFLTANTTKYRKNFVIIGKFTIIDKNAQNIVLRPRVDFFNEFFPLAREDNADLSKCMDASVTLGTTRVTFREMEETVIFVRTSDELPDVSEMDCFSFTSRKPSIETLTDTLEAPGRPKEDLIFDGITIFEVRASPSEPFYAVVLSYEPEFDAAKHKYHFAMVNKMVFFLEDLKHAGEVVYQLEEPSNVVQLFTTTPAIKVKVIKYSYAFKVLPFWMDQSMTHTDYQPLHNYFEGISYGGRPLTANSSWADIIVTKDRCTNTSRLNDSHVSLIRHHLGEEERDVNGTIQKVEHNMTETYEEYEDFHADQRDPCNDIDVLSQIKRTTKNLSKRDELVLEATDEKPIRVTLNLEEGEMFLLRFSSVEREESKCHDLDTVAIFLKDGMITNEKAYIRVFTYEALRSRNKTWISTGKLTIAIPNGCFKVALISIFSLQRARNFRNLYTCLIVTGLTILVCGTFILLYYKFSLAGREYRQLRRMYKRAIRNDNFVRHYLKWNENIDEIIAQWGKATDDN